MIRLAYQFNPFIAGTVYFHTKESTDLHQTVVMSYVQKIYFMPKLSVGLSHLVKLSYAMAELLRFEGSQYGSFDLELWP